MPSMIQIKNALLKDGWKLDHTSKADGRVSSYYFRKAEVIDARVKQTIIRVSDHDLGCNQWGEQQGSNFDLDWNVNDYDDAVPVSEFVEMARHPAVAMELDAGYTPMDDPEEWAAKLEEWA
jgi:hypothetical protein